MRWNLTNEHDSLDLDDMLDGIFNDKVGAAEKGHRVPEIGKRAATFFRVVCRSAYLLIICAPQHVDEAEQELFTSPRLVATE